MTMDHNICLGINGRCQILTWSDGKPKWGVFKPGEYAGHNIIERRGAEGCLLVSIRQARLRPPTEIRGDSNRSRQFAKRRLSTLRERRAGVPVDVGAYQHSR